MAVHKKLEPNYAKQHEWEVYGKQLMIEYEQSLDEGLELEEYRELFESAAKKSLLSGLVKKGDTVVLTAGLPLGEAGRTNMLRVVEV